MWETSQLLDQTVTAPSLHHQMQTNILFFIYKFQTVSSCNMKVPHLFDKGAGTWHLCGSSVYMKVKEWCRHTCLSEWDLSPVLLRARCSVSRARPCAPPRVVCQHLCIMTMTSQMHYVASAMLLVCVLSYFYLTSMSMSAIGTQAKSEGDK